MIPLNQQILDVLDARKAKMSGGPRTPADLARVTGIDPSLLSRMLRGERPISPAWEAAIRAALPEL